MGKMHAIKKLLVYTIAILIFTMSVRMLFSDGSTRRAISGIKDPIQKEADGGTTMELDGYDIDITYMYEYEIEGLVLTTNHHYWFGIDNDLSPIDVGLGWGDVAAYNNVIDFHWSQHCRFLYWKYKSYEDIARVGDEYDVNIQSSNNHLIGSNSSIKRKIKRIHAGDHIKLKGYLVDIYGTKDDGTFFSWTSSTVRDDSGDGACELIYVTDVEWL